MTSAEILDFPKDRTDIKNGTYKLGVVGVDAGIIWIGDPCYILHKEGKDRASLQSVIGKNWREFCDKLDNETRATQFNYELGHPGFGVCVGGFGGDGSYPVYAKVIDGLITSVWVNFMNEVPIT